MLFPSIFQHFFSSCLKKTKSALLQNFMVLINMYFQISLIYKINITFVTLRWLCPQNSYHKNSFCIPKCNFFTSSQAQTWYLTKPDISPSSSISSLVTSFSSSPQLSTICSNISAKLAYKEQNLHCFRTPRYQFICVLRSVLSIKTTSHLSHSKVSSQTSKLTKLGSFSS